jgi:hypothetical protein
MRELKVGDSQRSCHRWKVKPRQNPHLECMQGTGNAPAYIILYLQNYHHKLQRIDSGICISIYLEFSFSKNM